MASIRKRGKSYLIVVSMGYDYSGNRIKPRQKTVHPPEDLTPRQREKWLQEQAVLFERTCRDGSAQETAPEHGANDTAGTLPPAEKEADGDASE